MKFKHTNGDEWHVETVGGSLEFYCCGNYMFKITRSRLEVTEAVAKDLVTVYYVGIDDGERRGGAALQADLRRLIGVKP